MIFRLSNIKKLIRLNAAVYETVNQPVRSAASTQNYYSNEVRMTARMPYGQRAKLTRTKENPAQNAKYHFIQLGLCVLNRN